MYCGCKTQTPPRICQKNIKDTEKRRKKRGNGMEETEKAGNIVTEDRLRCENRICILKRL